MDFDSVISIFLVFIFFVLPVVLKKIQAKKKSAAGAVTVKKKTSLFERMGEQVQQFVKDLEEQAREGKKSEKNQSNIWETLTEGEKRDKDRPKTEAPVNGKRSIIEDWESASEKLIKPVQPGFNKKREGLAEKSGIYCRPGRYALNSRQKLRQAMVWSEILSKPVALRGK